MLRRSIVILGVLAVLAACVGYAVSQEPAPSTAPSEEPMLDLVVVVEQVGGQAMRYGKELDRMELILSPEGRLDQLHLVTRTGAEADTHIWYNVANLVSVRYQFLAITGKGKVSVRSYAPPQLRESTEGPRSRITPLDPEDYR